MQNYPTLVAGDDIRRTTQKQNPQQRAPSRSRGGSKTRPRSPHLTLTYPPREAARRAKRNILLLYNA